MSGRPRTTSFAEGNKQSPNPPLGGLKISSKYEYINELLTCSVYSIFSRSKLYVLHYTTWSLSRNPMTLLLLLRCWLDYLLTCNVIEYSLVRTWYDNSSDACKTWSTSWSEVIPCVTGGHPQRSCPEKVGYLIRNSHLPEYISGFWFWSYFDKLMRIRENTEIHLRNWWNVHEAQVT